MQLIESIRINAPIDKVWQVAAIDFHKVEDWVSSVAMSSENTNTVAPEGAAVGGRVCVAPGLGDIQETIVSFDAQKKRFRYRAKGLPFFVKDVVNEWSLREEGQQTILTLDLNMELNTFPGFFMSPIMKMQMTRILKETAEELKYFIETGQAHPRKIAAQQKALKQAQAQA